MVDTVLEKEHLRVEKEQSADHVGTIAESAPSHNHSSPSDIDVDSEVEDYRRSLEL
jgi:hypothetical protein